MKLFSLKRTKYSIGTNKDEPKFIRPNNPVKVLHSVTLLIAIRDKQWFSYSTRQELDL